MDHFHLHDQALVFRRRLNENDASRLVRAAMPLMLLLIFEHFHDDFQF
jgi:hypothetical protein